MTSRETLSRLRDVMARELETISMYEAYAEAETDPQMKTLFQHLADEEKEHVTEVYEAVLVRDAAQRKWAESGAHALAIRESRFSAEAAGGPSVGVTHSPSAPTLSVAVGAVGNAAVVATPSAAAVTAPSAAAVTPRVAPKAPGIRPTPPTVGSLLGAPQV